MIDNNHQAGSIEDGQMTKLRGSSRRLLFLAATALAVGIGLGGAGPGAAQEALKFGLALPLTGAQALYGQDQITAAEMAVADINKAGGVNGKKLEMVVLDTQADPQVGINAVNRLVRVEKVPVFVTGFSGVVKAVAPIANDNKVVELSVGANSPSVAQLGDYVYTTYPLADIDVTALAKYVHKDLGKKRAAILYINDETGTVAAGVFRKTFTDAGGQVVAFEAYDPKATDFTGQILKVRASNPDMIHIHGLVADTPQVIAQMRQLGLNQTVTSYAAIYNPRLIQSLGKGAEGIIVTSLAPGPSDSPKVKEYVDRWQKEKNREPNGLPYTQYLYDAPYLVAQVFGSLDKKGKKITGESFREEMLAIRTFDLPVTGKTEILPNHTVTKPVYLMEVKDGQWVRKAIVE
jgi:branched-chain amino acid transport system substrate-binding protein